MKAKIQDLLAQSIEHLAASGELSAEAVPEHCPVEASRRAGQGDYATGVAMSMARASGMKPRELAERIQASLPSAQFLERTEIAGPGFINFFIAKQALTGLVGEILKRGDDFGKSSPGTAGRILLEFVSANPNGPLHVGHGRGAAFGDALARLLRAAGHHVDTEYYVNDLGRQMDILCVSVWIRYLQLHNLDVKLPDNAYQGEYIIESAQNLKVRQHASLVCSDCARFDVQLEDGDAVLTELISCTRQFLGENAYFQLRDDVLADMMEMIRSDLTRFGVQHDRWFFESQVSKHGDVERAIRQLRERGFLYEADGATWFRSSGFGDEKDRVVVRANGDLTYFASDIAYHLDKLRRDYDLVINIWGADHHGYVTRMKAAMEACGEDPQRLQILLVQFATLYRDSVKASMSTRTGEFVSLKELIEETGRDAARFFYILRKSEQHLDFDLELAKRQTGENPVYYVQYAHARICSVVRQLHERGLNRTDGDHSLLTEDSELDLLRRLSRFPDVVHSAANDYEPHQVAYYLRDVATDFHSFYNKERILDCADALRCARLDLIDSVRQVLANGLDIIGVSAPTSM
ncbi:MAG: arginine--tRNA ligase [Acidiferrobacterales bacterium]|nr:arginine--tRNA ligase [Acidiferrobacterales bacterium]